MNTALRKQLQKCSIAFAAIVIMLLLDVLTPPARRQWWTTAAFAVIVMVGFALEWRRERSKGDNA